MEPVLWKDFFNVGVKEVDLQHQKLFSIVNELIAGKNSHREKETIDNVLKKLADYTVYHFSTEEKFFKMHPGFRRHRGIHKNFVEKVSDFISDFNSGKAKLSSEILNFLIDWLKAHILDMDKNYFEQLHYSCLKGDDRENSCLDMDLTCDRILIVDDAIDQRFLLKTVLEQEGHDVIEAANGAEALHICQDNPDIRIVVTDINMPVMDGYELIKSLRQQQSHYIYIIVITSGEGKENVIKALSAGADDFLSKPIVPQELNLRIRGGQRLISLESQDELIFSMAKLSDYRSLETGKHLERVRAYTYEIGMYMALHHPEKKLTRQMAEEISKVSPMHDIGKVGIEDKILTKPGRLTHEEFEIMKTHSKIGGDLISDIYLKTGSPSLRVAFELTMYHHEKWDGTGYPAGLSGTGIPIAARIMALADVYDALTSKRVYKDAFSHEKSKQIIVEDKGIHFDPDLVDIFLAIEKNFIQLKNVLSDDDE